jgi:hypothetical protein|tara:strand:+ start:418 stop:735 length:318 start_codon:yes stop_codon:yes gene_type:complete
MKKILYLFVLTFFVSCSLKVGLSGATKKMNKINKKIYTGMTTKEFKKKVPNAVLVNSISGITEYKVVVNYSYIGTDMNRWKLEQLFVFEDNELTEITSPKERRIR